jgi:hypothetical protein
MRKRQEDPASPAPALVPVAVPIAKGGSVTTFGNFRIRREQLLKVPGALAKDEQRPDRLGLVNDIRPQARTGIVSRDENSIPNC